VTNITFKPIQSFYSEGHKANIANTAKINAKVKDLCTECDAIDASIAANEDMKDPNPEARIAALADGRDAPPTVPPPSARRLEILYDLRDCNEALDYLAGKDKIFKTEAGRRMVEDARPQIVAAEKELFELLTKIHEKYLPYWQAMRSLLSNSIGTNGLFANDIDDVLGVPTDVNSGWADIFRGGVASGYVKKMPAALRPKT
jgi:hypothetical protein